MKKQNIKNKEISRSISETLYLISQPKVMKKIKDGEKEDISKMNIYNPKEPW